MRRRTRTEAKYGHPGPEDSGRPIGRRARRSSTFSILNRPFQQDENADKVLGDVAGYRFSEQDKLVDKAIKPQIRFVAGATSSNWPMNSYDRRIIHNALKDDPEIETASVEVDGTHDKASSFVQRAKSLKDIYKSVPLKWNQPNTTFSARHQGTHQMSDPERLRHPCPVPPPCKPFPDAARHRPAHRGGIRHD